MGGREDKRFLICLRSHTRRNYMSVRETRFTVEASGLSFQHRQVLNDELLYFNKDLVRKAPTLSHIERSISLSPISFFSPHFFSILFIHVITFYRH